MFWRVYLLFTGEHLHISDKVFYPFVNLFNSYIDLYKMITFNVWACHRVVQLSNCVLCLVPHPFLINSCSVETSRQTAETRPELPVVQRKKWEAEKLWLLISQRSIPVITRSLLRNRAEMYSFCLLFWWCSLNSGHDLIRSYSTSLYLPAGRWLPWSGCE